MSTANCVWIDQRQYQRSMIVVHLGRSITISLNVPLPLCSRKNRYSSVLEFWVRWRSFATSVSARSCPGCKLTSGVTWPVRTTRNSRSNVWLSWSSRGTWGNTSNSAPGRGGSCGRRSSHCSTSLASRTRWPWVSLRDLASRQTSFRLKIVKSNSNNYLNRLVFYSNCRNLFFRHYYFSLWRLLNHLFV